MKRLLTIIGVVVFFLVLLVLLIGKLFFSHPTQDKTAIVQKDPFADVSVSSQPIYTDTAYRTAISCYNWYIHASGQGANSALTADRSEAKQCFTGTFISQWQSIIESSGSDPVILSQDIGRTWLTSITAVQVSQSVNSSDEQVTFGIGEEAHMVIAHIVRNQDGNWQIDSVSRQ